MKSKWNDPKVKKALISFMKTGGEGPDAAAEYFSKYFGKRITVNAVKLAYRRRNGEPVPKKKYKSKANVLMTAPAVKSNPFEIMTDISATGVRGSSNVWIPALLEQVLKLEAGDLRSSVNIPITVAPEKNNASNLVLTLRRMMSENSNKAIRDITFISKTIYNTKKEYVGTRIWRKL